MYSKFLKMMDDIKRGDVSMLGDFHGSTCSLKSLTTWGVQTGIETCRQSLGGHGYNHFSGLIRLYCDIVPACTYEGENVVMCLQTARYILKQQSVHDSRGASAVSPDIIYMMSEVSLKSKSVSKGPLDFLAADVQLAALHHRAAFILQSVKTNMRDDMTSRGLSFDQAYNNSSNDLVRLSLAHAEVIVASSFIDFVKSVKAKDLQSVLKDLCDLYILNIMLDKVRGSMSCMFRF
jgi:acyl-CoA oxidase